MRFIQSLTRALPPGVRSKLTAAVRKAIVSQGFVPHDAKNHYAEDGLYTIHNDSFRRDPRFRAAYERGIQAGNGVDQHLEWRIHVALWAASTALHAPGDFVECGVNAGFVSSAIMRRLNWASLARTYYLIDTFAGPVIGQYSEAETQAGMTQMVERARAAGAYVTDVNRARSNFAEWPNAVVVQGAVPEVLPQIRTAQVAFLHLDMNCAMPERAALEHFWPLLSRGGVVLLDDYAYAGHGNQKEAMDATAGALGADVLSLPTGQGLIVR
jgi:hypothetical protein